MPPITGQWPVPMNSDVMNQVREAALMVHDALHGNSARVPSADPLIKGWDDAIAAIEKELQRDTETIRTLSLPSSLSVTQVQKLSSDQQAFIDSLIRPMPQEPAPAAAQGTTFHAWVEQRGRSLQGVGAMPTLPGMEDYDDDIIVTLDTANLKKFQQNFESSQWADKKPEHVEHPFHIMIGGRLIRGKIDAIYQDGDDWILVDWKTNSTPSADPLQLSIYRAAWAEEKQIPLETIKACFYYVALNATVYADDLLSRDEIAKLLN
jgi:DNA helicase-2/ATP-dependent DNA helicase PcrA